MSLRLHMLKILVTLFFIMAVIQSNAQRRFSPTGFASPYSTNWYRVGWIQGDSGAIDAVRDTTLGASFPGVRFLWMHSGKDSSEWVFNGNAYIKNLNTQDTLPGRFLVTPSFLASQGFLKNITSLIQQGTNITITGSGTIGSPYVINSSGGTSVDSAVNPGLFLKQSLSGTTKTIYADTSLATGFSGYYLRRGDTNVYTTPTQLATGLATKQGTITLGTTAQYFRGDLSLATFPTNLSAFTNGPGYITGNQSISFTASGDINGTFTNPTTLTPTLTINANAVTYSKFQQAAGQGLLGAQSAGNYQLVTLGSGLSLTGDVLSATGGGGSGCSNCNADSLKKLPVDTSLRRNGYALTFDSTDHKWVLAPNGSGTGITALTGDGTASGSGSVAFTLATVNSNVGTFGSASSVAQVALNGKGLATSASSIAIQIAESQVTNLTTDLAGKQSALSGTGYLNFTGSTPSYLTPTQVTANLNLFTTSLQGLVPGSGGGTTNFLRADGTWAAPPGGGGAVASVTNSDGTLTISPTTGAVIASLALGHANTWITNAQTFNGGVVLGNNLTYATDNTYQLGTSSLGASHVWSRVFNSDAGVSLSSTTGNPASISIGATAGITLLATGQAQFNNYTSSGFSGTSNDSILTINPANGQIGWKWGQPFNIYAVQGVSPIGTSSDSIALGGAAGAFYQNDTLYINGHQFLWYGLTGQSTPAGTDSVVIKTAGQQLKSVPASAFAGAVDSAVNPGVGLKQTISGTTKTLYADTSLLATATHLEKIYPMGSDTLYRLLYGIPQPTGSGVNGTQINWTWLTGGGHSFSADLDSCIFVSSAGHLQPGFATAQEVSYGNLSFDEQTYPFQEQTIINLDNCDFGIWLQGSGIGANLVGNGTSAWGIQSSQLQTYTLTIDTSSFGILSFDLIDGAGQYLGSTTDGTIVEYTGSNGYTVNRLWTGLTRNYRYQLLDAAGNPVVGQPTTSDRITIFNGSSYRSTIDQRQFLTATNPYFASGLPNYWFVGIIRVFPDSLKIIRPLNFAVVGAGTGNVNISWTAVSNAGNGYELDRSTSPNFSTAVTVLVNFTSVTSYADTGLTSGTIYYYRLRASRLTNIYSGWELRSITSP